MISADTIQLKGRTKRESTSSDKTWSCGGLTGRRFTPTTARLKLEPGKSDFHREKCTNTET
jgi:hypothetical protein